MTDNTLNPTGIPDVTEFNRTSVKLESKEPKSSVFSSLESFGGGFMRDNTILSQAFFDKDLVDQDQPYSHELTWEQRTAGYEDNSHLFVFSKTPNSDQQIKTSLDLQKRAEQATMANPVSGFLGSMAGGVLDLPTFLGVVGGGAKFVKAGENILDVGVRTAAVAGAETSVSEVLLQEDQELRTGQESAMAIGGSVLLGGLLGTAAGAIVKNSEKLTTRKLKNFKELSNEVREYTTVPREGEVDETLDFIRPVDDSAGAMRVQDVNPEHTKIADSLGVTKLLANKYTEVLGVDFTGSPSLRMMNSENGATRLAALHLSEVGYATKGMQSGDFTAPMNVERGIEIERMRLGYAENQSLVNFQNLQKRAGGKDSPESMTYKQFSEAVFDTRISGIDSPIPEVNAAAKEYNTIMQEMGQRLVDNGLMSKEVLEKGGNYVNRVYKEFTPDLKPSFQSLLKNKYAQRRQVSIERLADLELEEPKIKTELDELRKLGKQATLEQKAKMDELEEALTDIEVTRHFAKQLDEEIADAVELTIARIERGRMGELGFDLDGGLATYKGKDADTPSFLKRRTLDFITNEELAPYLVKDNELISQMYVRNIAPKLVMAERTGDVDGNKLLTDIAQEWQRKIGKLETQAKNSSAEKSKKINKEIAKMKKARDKDIQHFEEERDRLLGAGVINPRWDNTSRALRALKSFNIFRLMGGLVISSLPDTARYMVIRNMAPSVAKTVKKFATSKEMRKLAKEEARSLNGVLSLIQDTRNHNLTELNDNYGRINKFDMMLSDATSKFFRLTGATHWNNMHQTIVNSLSGHNIIESAIAEAGGKASRMQKQTLREGGITPESAKIISQLYKKHGMDYDGIKMSGAGDWDMTNPAIKQAHAQMSGAIARDVDIVVLNPGSAKPAWLSTNLGSVIGQFKSFAYGSNQKTLLRVAQQISQNPNPINNPLPYMFMSTSIAMGITTRLLKLYLAGRLAETASWTVADYVLEGADASGLYGSMTELNAMMEAGSGGMVGLSAIGNREQGYRASQRSSIEGALGPSIQPVNTLLSLFGNISPDNDLSRGEISAARRLFFLNNHPFVKPFGNIAEETVADWFDVPK